MKLGSMYSICGSAPSTDFSCAAAASPFPVRTRCSPGTLLNSCEADSATLPSVCLTAVGDAPALNLTRNSPGTALRGSGTGVACRPGTWLEPASRAAGVVAVTGSVAGASRAPPPGAQPYSEAARPSPAMRIHRLATSSRFIQPPGPDAAESCYFFSVNSAPQYGALSG